MSLLLPYFDFPFLRFDRAFQLFDQCIETRQFGIQRFGFGGRRSTLRRWRGSDRRRLRRRLLLCLLLCAFCVECVNVCDRSRQETIESEFVARLRVEGALKLAILRFLGHMCFV